jgi:hypothetical protein
MPVPEGIDHRYMLFTHKAINLRVKLHSDPGGAQHQLAIKVEHHASQGGEQWVVEQLALPDQELNRRQG